MLHQPPSQIVGEHATIQGAGRHSGISVSFAVISSLIFHCHSQSFPLLSVCRKLASYLPLTCLYAWREGRTPLLLSVHFRYRPLRKKEVERKKNGNGSRFGRMNTEDRRTSERHGKQENIMVLLPLPSLSLTLCLLMESFRTARSVAFHPFPKVISRGASVIIQNRMASTPVETKVPMRVSKAIWVLY